MEVTEFKSKIVATVIYAKEKNNTDSWWENLHVN